MKDLLDQFTATETVSLAEMDALVKAYKTARDIHTEKKSIADQAREEMEAIERKLLHVLESAGKASYIVNGVGLVSVVHKETVRVPQGEDKFKFFEWIEKEYGKEGLEKYMTVNSQSLNSLFKMVREEGKTIAGIGEPSVQTTLSFRKK